MLTEPQKQWVAALRSGEYKQTYGRLCRGDSYCCLGVACEVAIKASVPVRKEAGPDGPVLYDGVQLSVPTSVRRWLGLTTDEGSYERGSLINDNDKKGKTFAEIADIIESEPEGLFV